MIKNFNDLKPGDLIEYTFPDGSKHLYFLIKKYDEKCFDVYFLHRSKFQRGFYRKGFHNYASPFIKIYESQY